jgi:hypothetical protein
MLARDERCLSAQVIDPITRFRRGRNDERVCGRVFSQDNLSFFEK